MGPEDLRHHISDAHRSRYRAGTCGPDSQGRWLFGRGLSAIAMRTPSSEAGLVYQLKITLLEVEPSIWRRLRVSASQTLETLHTVIQKGHGLAEHPSLRVRGSGPPIWRARAG